MTQKFAQIFLPRKDLPALTYFVPSELVIKPGDCVEIELKKSITWGIVEKITETIPDEISGVALKPVLGKIFSSPMFSNKKETRLLKWLSDYYIYPFPNIIKQIYSPLVTKKCTLAGESDPDRHRSVLQSNALTQDAHLNETQKTGYDSIIKRWEKGDNRPVLLFGITGSGKSEIFAALCKKVISEGKQVLYLVPEVGLTTNALEHLIYRVGSPGVIIHSSMTPKKRFSSIYSAMHGKASIIVGTRSAALYPFFDPGLIIVDEEHDSSYKNFEPPYYNARDFAVMKGHVLNIPVVMGSATPSSDSWHNAVTGKYHLEILPERANRLPLPKIDMFNYKGDLYLPGHLINTVRESLKMNEQTLFFLNRRGFATLAVCTDCRETVKCPDCKTALIYHKNKKKLLCHHCNYSIKDFHCSKCGGNLEFEGMGIEKLVETIFEFFPGTTIVSFDRDNLSSVKLFDNAVKSITDNTADIIVGTVMISKGHNFPRLRNVIIKYADYLLSFNDSRAAEKCFQLVTQVAGRAGRFEVAGSVYAEALYPDHYLWKHILKYDYKGFMTEELEWRHRLSLPPFTRMIIIRISGKAEKTVNNAAATVHSVLEKRFNEKGISGFTLFPVTEPPLSKIRNNYRKVITVITPKNGNAHRHFLNFISNIRDLKGVSITFDVDPLNET